MFYQLSLGYNHASRFDDNECDLMTHPLIPAPPQTGRQTPSLSEQARYKLLNQRHDEDRRDPFAIDPHTTIRQLGRVLLRRPSVDGYFALGDLCVGQSLTDDGSLLIAYLGKGLLAYQRAHALAKHDIDRVRAERASGQLREWTMTVARLLPSPRNLATALWTLTDDGGGIAANVPGSSEVTSLLAAMLHPQTMTQTAVLDDPDRTSSAVTIDGAPGFSEFTDTGDGTSSLGSLKVVASLFASHDAKLNQTAASDMPRVGMGQRLRATR